MQIEEIKNGIYLQAPNQARAHFFCRRVRSACSSGLPGKSRVSGEKFSLCIQKKSEKRETTPTWDFPYHCKTKRNLPFSLLTKSSPDYGRRLMEQSYQKEIEEIIGQTACPKDFLHL
jgi:hypothetical protein